MGEVFQARTALPMYVWTGLAALAAAVDLVAVAFGWEGIRIVTKPLPAVLLALAVTLSGTAPRVLAAGLIFAALGDVLLLHPGNLEFMLGMAAFALMHVCYIAGFARIGHGPGLVRRQPLLAVPYALAVIATDVLLLPHAGTFALPVAVYGALLAAMALSALNAAGRLQNARAAWLLAGGALIFMTSDTLLAFAKFWPAFPLAGTAAEVAILGTYFIAQIAIATGAISAASA